MSAPTLDVLVLAYFAVGVLLTGVWLSADKEIVDNITPLSFFALVTTWPVFALLAVGVALGHALKSRGV